ncbi:MAG: helicase-related protein, partial [Acidobacteriota bacterium]
TARQLEGSRFILMSGTPHQGHPGRFDNLLKLLRGSDSGPLESLNGRVIYRTKDDIRDWDGNPVFPPRQVNPPTLVDLGPEHRTWISDIHDFYSPSTQAAPVGEARTRAAGWRCAQALQWAASSPQAGLGYLTRQAIRAGWSASEPILRRAIAELRPYRLGPPDQPVDELFNRMKKEVDRQRQDAELEDLEEYADAEDTAMERVGLQALLEEGIEIVRTSGDEKWRLIERELLGPAGDEKVVLFAQPIETVTSLARFLETRTGRRPALIMGGQTDDERRREVDAFWRADGPQYLVSSRAGGEGINLQIARRLIHIDVPWNPMDLEQRVGRIHRFGSRKTVIVDTLIVKDSREADAYLIARKKLRLIASTLVEKEKFESVFSRVMCLLSQEKLQEIILNAPEAPFDLQDESSLSKMIQDGFDSWKEFHDRFGEEQQTIKSQNPGLATWEDIAFFFETLGGAERVHGFRKHSFEGQEEQNQQAEEEVTVLRLGNTGNFVCGDIGEAFVFGRDDTSTPRLGLNLPEAAEILRKFAFPPQPCGPAHLRWPTAVERPRCLDQLPTGVLVFLRQTFRDDRSGGWTEIASDLSCFAVSATGREVVQGRQLGDLLRGLFRAVFRKTPAENEALLARLEVAEIELGTEIRRPSEEEMKNQIRHSVTPLFAAIVD